jgi:glycosyltransferase involved in cell wall biosynthesis
MCSQIIKLKILHVIPYFIRATKTGGPAIQLFKLDQALSKIGNEITIVTSTGNLKEEIDLDFEGDMYETLEQGLSTVYLRRRKSFLPSTYYFAPNLCEWLESNIQRFNIVIIHGVWTYFSWIGARICNKAGKPYLYFVHGCLDRWALNYHKIKKIPYWHLIEKPNFQKAHGFIVLSEDEANQVHTMGIEKPLFLARNGLIHPVSQVANPENILKNQLPGLNGHPFVLFMSRLHPKKGLEVLLHAWSAINYQYPEWRLVIAGPDEGEYRSKIVGLMEELRLHDSVLFPGLVLGDIKAALFQRASLFVLPSFSEGVPGAVIESMGYGIPVLITPGCHLPEVADARAGLIVEPEIIAVKDGLDCLISDKNLRQQMGRNAELLARNEFDEMKVAEGLVHFCNHILNKEGQVNVY